MYKSGFFKFYYYIVYVKRGRHGFTDGFFFFLTVRQINPMPSRSHFRESYFFGFDCGGHRFLVHRYRYMKILIRVRHYPMYCVPPMLLKFHWNYVVRMKNCFYPTDDITNCTHNKRSYKINRTPTPLLWIGQKFIFKRIESS